MVMCGNSAKSWKTRPIERFSGGRKICRSGDLAAVEQHAAGGLRLDAGGNAQQRRLAGAGGAEQAEHLPGSAASDTSPQRLGTRREGMADVLEDERARRR